MTNLDSKNITARVAVTLLPAALTPTLTKNLSVAAQVIHDGARTFLEPGAGLINNNGQISANNNSFGFALEHLQALGFNLNASLRGADARAYQIPVDGVAHGPDIYVSRAGEVIAEIQAKAGDSSYVERMVASGNYKQPIVTNAENNAVEGASTVISVDGINSIPVSLQVAHMVKDHPYSAAALLEAAATVGEVSGAGVVAATVNAGINVILESIHQLAPVCRGEKEMEWALLKPILAQALAGLQSGFIRGAAVKVLQCLAGGHSMAALGITLTSEAIPSLIRLVQGDITLEQALAEIGPQMLTSGVITIMVLLFPPVGVALLSGSVLQAIWSELSPEWTAALRAEIDRTGRAAAAGTNAAMDELKENPLNWLGSSAASTQASRAELTQSEALLDALLE